MPFVTVTMQIDGKLVAQRIMLQDIGGWRATKDERGRSLWWGPGDSDERWPILETPEQIDELVRQAESRSPTQGSISIDRAIDLAQLMCLRHLDPDGRIDLTFSSLDEALDELRALMSKP